MSNNLSIILLLGIIFLFGRCSLDKPKYSENVTKDFNLGYWSDHRYTALFLNNDHTEYGGREIIPETVVEIGFDEDFIIAKQHPNIYKEIEERVLSNEMDNDFKLSAVSDTIYLPKSYLFSENGEWYFKKEGVDQLDYLFPYEEVTNYYIISIGDYRLRYWQRDGNVYTFDNQADFNQKRKELGVSNSIKLAPVLLSDAPN